MCAGRERLRLADEEITDLQRQLLCATGYLSVHCVDRALSKAIRQDGTERALPWYIIRSQPIILPEIILPFPTICSLYMIGNSIRFSESRPRCQSAVPHFNAMRG
jgi:hypothetical protein